MFERVALGLPPAICDEFRLALKRGRWANGLPLTQEHRRTCQEALFYHDALGFDNTDDLLQ